MRATAGSTVVALFRLRAGRDPCGDAPPGSPGPRGCACAAGNRGSWHGGGCSAGRYACSRSGSIGVFVRCLYPPGASGALDPAGNSRPAWTQTFPRYGSGLPRSNALHQDPAGDGPASHPGQPAPLTSRLSPGTASLWTSVVTAAVCAPARDSVAVRRSSEHGPSTVSTGRPVRAGGCAQDMHRLWIKLWTTMWTTRRRAASFRRSPRRGRECQRA